MKVNKIKFVLIVLFLAAGFLNNRAESQLLNTVVALTGNVFDAVTKEPVTVFVIVNDEWGNKVTATRSNAFENGYYYVTGLRPGNKYTIILEYCCCLTAK
ncbi:MAG: hypothetical protein UV60_C0031G0002 [Parcubacteria group bacterium GW2011_GWA2_43_11]|nr:MAG: hypothetical protein UV60_C0031G0002 [Parcubacteria group bacterium GW2011_GWA2_43_11]